MASLKPRAYSVITKNHIGSRLKRLEEYVDFKTFIELYYKWVDEQYISGNSDIDSLENLADIDKCSDRFLFYYKESLAKEFANSTESDFRMVLKQVNDLFRAKGTEKAVRYFFRAVYNSDSDIYYPNEDLLIPSSSKWLKEHIVFLYNPEGKPPDWFKGKLMYYIKEVDGAVTSLNKTYGYCYIDNAELYPYDDCHIQLSVTDFHGGDINDYDVYKIFESQADLDGDYVLFRVSKQVIDWKVESPYRNLSKLKNYSITHVPEELTAKRKENKEDYGYISERVRQIKEMCTYNENNTTHEVTVGIPVKETTTDSSGNNVIKTVYVKLGNSADEVLTKEDQDFLKNPFNEYDNGYVNDYIDFDETILSYGGHYNYDYRELESIETHLVFDIHYDKTADDGRYGNSSDNVIFNIRLIELLEEMNDVRNWTTFKTSSASMVVWDPDKNTYISKSDTLDKELYAEKWLYLDTATGVVHTFFKESGLRSYLEREKGLTSETIGNPKTVEEWADIGVEYHPSLKDRYPDWLIDSANGTITVPNILVRGLSPPTDGRTYVEQFTNNGTTYLWYEPEKYIDDWGRFSEIESREIVEDIFANAYLSYYDSMEVVAYRERYNYETAKTETEEVVVGYVAKNGVKVESCSKTSMTIDVTYHELKRMKGAVIRNDTFALRRLVNVDSSFVVDPALENIKLADIPFLKSEMDVENPDTQFVFAGTYETIGSIPLSEVVPTEKGYTKVFKILTKTDRYPQRTNYYWNGVELLDDEGNPYLSAYTERYDEDGNKIIPEWNMIPLEYRISEKYTLKKIGSETPVYISENPDIVNYVWYDLPHFRYVVLPYTLNGVEYEQSSELYETHHAFKTDLELHNALVVDELPDEDSRRNYTFVSLRIPLDIYPKDGKERPENPEENQMIVYVENTGKARTIKTLVSDNEYAYEYRPIYNYWKLQWNGEIWKQVDSILGTTELKPESDIFYSFEKQYWDEEKQEWVVADSVPNLVSLLYPEEKSEPQFYYYTVTDSWYDRDNDVVWDSGEYVYRTSDDVNSIILRSTINESLLPEEKDRDKSVEYITRSINGKDYSFNLYVCINDVWKSYDITDYFDIRTGFVPLRHTNYSIVSDGINVSYSRYSADELEEGQLLKTVTTYYNLKNVDPNDLSFKEDDVLNYIRIQGTKYNYYYQYYYGLNDEYDGKSGEVGPVSKILHPEIPDKDHFVDSDEILEYYHLPYELLAAESLHVGKLHRYKIYDGGTGQKNGAELTITNNGRYGYANGSGCKARGYTDEIGETYEGEPLYGDTITSVDIYAGGWLYDKSVSVVGDGLDIELYGDTVGGLKTAKTVRRQCGLSPSFNEQLYYFNNVGDFDNSLSENTVFVQPKIGNCLETTAYFEEKLGVIGESSVIQDFDYYQLFSYVLTTELNKSDYIKLYKKFLHPAGYKMFERLRIFSLAFGDETNGADITQLVKIFIWSMYNEKDIGDDVWEPAYDFRLTRDIYPRLNIQEPGNRLWEYQKEYDTYITFDEYGNPVYNDIETDHYLYPNKTVVEEYGLPEGSYIHEGFWYGDDERVWVGEISPGVGKERGEPVTLIIDSGGRFRGHRQYHNHVRDTKPHEEYALNFHKFVPKELTGLKNHYRNILLRYNSKVQYNFNLENIPENQYGFHKSDGNRYRFRRYRENFFGEGDTLYYDARPKIDVYSDDIVPYILRRKLGFPNHMYVTNYETQLRFLIDYKYTLGSICYWSRELTNIMPDSVIQYPEADNMTVKRYSLRNYDNVSLIPTFKVNGINKEKHRKILVSLRYGDYVESHSISQSNPTQADFFNTDTHVFNFTTRIEPYYDDEETGVIGSDEDATVLVISYFDMYDKKDDSTGEFVEPEFYYNPEDGKIHVKAEEDSGIEYQEKEITYWDKTDRTEDLPDYTIGKQSDGSEDEDRQTPENEWVEHPELDEKETIEVPIIPEGAYLDNDEGVQYTYVPYWAETGLGNLH